MTSFAILCPGQGAQSATMFDHALAEPRGAAVLEVFSEVSGIDLVARLSAGGRLDENCLAQPAIVSAAVATWSGLAPLLPAPALFVGYSVGEVSAWACAGAWDAREAATVVARRVEAMDAYGPAHCGMVAVLGLSRDDVEHSAPQLFVAIVNASDHLVLAGPEDAIDAATPALVARGATVRRLDVRVPSHTPLMREAATRFEAAMRANPARDIASRVLRGVDGSAAFRGSDATRALVRAIDEPIRWDACLCALSEARIDVALELGPGRALTTLCAAQCPQIVVRSVADFRSLRGVVDWLLRQLD